MTRAESSSKRNMKVNDFHCHFFSSGFLRALGLQAGMEDSGELALDVASRLDWENPGSDLDLAQRWVEELDEHGVDRIALIASLPGQEDSVSRAIGAFRERFVGQFMIDPSQPDAAGRARQGLQELGLRVICLFPAMHRFRLDSDEVMAICEAADELGGALFVHCGVLTVGVRRKLGLPSPFDVRLGNPLDLQRAALSFPQLPIVIPHFGAGFFREALIAADLHANIYLDTSSSNSWVKYFPNVTLKTALATALDVVGSERLLFGTDSSFFPRGWQPKILQTQKAVLENLGVSREEQEAIFSRNFDRLFPL